LIACREHHHGMPQVPPLAILTSPVALTLDGGATTGAPKRVQLLPAGFFAAKDGRPGSLEGSRISQWRLNEGDAAQLIQAMGRNEMLIDYEHQTLHAQSNGHPAPAAGWFSEIAFVPDAREPDGDQAGLWASDVRWTPKARAHIEAGEYRYISPVFLFEPDTGAVLRLLHVALTNNPALDGMTPVTAAALTALSARFPLSTTQEQPMNKLLAAMGLAADATEATALTALATLQGRADLSGSKDAEIAALKANQFDPAKHIPMTEHKKVTDQLAALTANADKAEHEGLMAVALADARILPVNETYWRAQPLAALKEFLKDAKPVAALAGTQTGGKPPPSDNKTTAALTADEQAMAKAFGQTPEQFAQAKKSA
jgi:phage I-like protein